MVGRVLAYAGWALGLPALGLAAMNQRVGGILMITAALLLLGGARADVARAVSFEGNPKSFNLLVVAVAVCWLGFGVAVLVT